MPVAPLLEQMFLADKAKTLVKHLSGGQKQRLAIALALLNEPLIVFLDEPTTGLDPQARRTLWDIILDMKEQGKTIVLSTHYMDEAHALCDRICLMDRGEIIALDTPRNLVRRLQSDSALEFRIEENENNPDLLSHLNQLNAVKRVDIRDRVVTLYTDDLQASLLDFAQFGARVGLRFSDLRTRTATLDDVFIHMTGRRLREA